MSLIGLRPIGANERGELAVVIKKNSPSRENSFKTFEAYMERQRQCLCKPIKVGKEHDQADKTDC